MTGLILNLKSKDGILIYNKYLILLLEYYIEQQRFYMSMKGISKNRSIKSTMMNIFMIIILMMALSTWNSSYRQGLITEEYNRLVENNTILSRLSISIDQMIKYSDMYLRERDPKYYELYCQANLEIVNALDSVDKDAMVDGFVSIYFRSLKAMHEYQQEVVETIREYNQLDPYVYKEVSYLKQLYTYMSSQSRLLATSYLDYSTTKYAELLQNFRYVQQNVYVVTIIVGIVSIFIAWVLSNGFFSIIDELSKVAGLLSTARWDVPDIKSYRYAELDMVAGAFNNMKNSIKAYIEELSRKAEVEIQLNNEKLLNAEKDRLLKESQLLALQMQMNPHFLFNTLNMIGRTAMLEDNKSTIGLIEAISQILRYNLDKGKVVTLQEEIDVLRAYIYIQEMRFQERMSFKLNICGYIEDAIIPPMTLQPIVENAIIHGLCDKPKDGIISIDILRQSDYIKIMVNDNGKGISKSVMDEIFTEKDRSISKKSSIGLSSVKKRLELYFMQDDLISIQSEVDAGTVVTVLIPVNRDEKISHKEVAYSA